MASIFRELSYPKNQDLGEDQNLESIQVKDLEDWQKKRNELKEQWFSFLGTPSITKPVEAPQMVESVELSYCNATLFLQQTGPKTRQQVVILEPLEDKYSPRPAALIPFYRTGTMSGYDFQEKAYVTERPETQFGRHLVKLGYVVACVEAFPFNTVSRPEEYKGFALWREAAKILLNENPEWTGLGKLVWDTRLAGDLLFSQPNIDPERTLIMGHSLGGKMAFYTGSLDERFKAIVASDFGIGYDFTNWDDIWYLGDKIHELKLNLAHHQLLALHAPGIFLLIAGEYDKAESWQYINEARKVYSLYDREEALAMLHHGTGHRPPVEAMVTTYEWLAEGFGLSKDGISKELIFDY